MQMEFPEQLAESCSRHLDELAGLLFQGDKVNKRLARYLLKVISAQKSLFKKHEDLMFPYRTPEELAEIFSSVPPVKEEIKEPTPDERDVQIIPDEDIMYYAISLENGIKESHLYIPILINFVNTGQALSLGDIYNFIEVKYRSLFLEKDFISQGHGHRWKRIIYDSVDWLRDKGLVMRLEDGTYQVAPGVDRETLAGWSIHYPFFTSRFTLTIDEIMERYFNFRTD
jgi:hypothetical protein